MTSPTNSADDMQPIEPSARPNPFFFRSVERTPRFSMWEVLYREPQEPERFGEPADNDIPTEVPFFVAGYLFMKTSGADPEVAVTGHPKLTYREATEIADQAEIIAREAALERILD